MIIYQCPDNLFCVSLQFQRLYSNISETMQACHVQELRWDYHYNDVIMSATAPQITSLTSA